MMRRIPKWLALCGIACLFLLASLAVAPVLAPGPVAEAVDWLQALPGEDEPKKPPEKNSLAQAAESAWAVLYGPDGFIKDKSDCVPASDSRSDCLSVTDVSTTVRGSESGAPVALAFSGASDSLGSAGTASNGGGGSGTSGGASSGGYGGSAPGVGGPSGGMGSAGSNPNTALASAGDAITPATFPDKVGATGVPPARTDAADMLKIDGPIAAAPDDNRASPTPLLDPPAIQGPTDPNGPALPPVNASVPAQPGLGRDNPNPLPSNPPGGGFPGGPGNEQPPSIAVPPVGFGVDPTEPVGLEHSAGLDPPTAVITIVDVTIKEENGNGAATPTVGLFAVAVGEPSTLWLGVLALLFFGFSRRRQR